MALRKIKLFFMLHWIKIIVIFVVLTILVLAVVGMMSLESFYRDLTLAQMPVTILMGGVHSLIFVFLLMWLHYGGGFSKMQKSPIKRENVNIKWQDVIGMEDAKQEAKEVVQLIMDRARLQKMGGKFLRGIMMLGPPGCGKTYLAKAIATETGLPFISLSGSEFVEIFVGVGASRVRKLFKMARQHAYGHGGCIIFIDEIDGIARKRSFSAFGSSETDSTQNQLLAELDGLKDKEDNIVVIGATNASEDTLDKALLRPGRFDRKIYITLPSLDEREEQFKYYLDKVKHDETINIPRLARKAVYKTPADIANIVREATLIAARYKKDLVGMKEIAEAIERIDMGIKQKRTLMPQEKERIAYHEAGHLLPLYLTHPTDDVFKASIISRKDTLGAVYHQPKEEILLHDSNRILADIKVCLGSYVAEKLRFGNTSNGVSDDFNKAMLYAHNMVWRFGMADDPLLGDYTAIPESQLSEDIKLTLNRKTQDVIAKCLKEVENLLNRERQILDRFAKELVEKEELDYDEIDAIFSEYGKGHVIQDPKKAQEKSAQEKPDDNSKEAKS